MNNDSLGAGIFLGIFFGFGPIGWILIAILGGPRLKKGFWIGLGSTILFYALLAGILCAILIPMYS